MKILENNSNKKLRIKKIMKMLDNNVNKENKNNERKKHG